MLSAALVSDNLAQFPTMFATGTSIACRTIVPDGGGVVEFDTVTLTGTDVFVLPAASLATAVSTWAPFDTVVVFHGAEYGVLVSSAPTFTPSSLNCTPTTPTLSELVAESVVVPETVEPSAGDEIATSGSVVSGGGGDTTGLAGSFVLSFFCGPGATVK